MKKDILKSIQETKKAVLRVPGFNPVTGIIAGSGLGNLKNRFKIIKSINYSDIPNFSKTTVEGHSGELVLCEYKKQHMLVFNGRFHFYEGHPAQDTVYPVRFMRTAGVKNLIITAATGGVNKKYSPGDIVILKDHINLTGHNPLRGMHHKEFGDRFPDMCNIYDAKLRKKALSISKKYKIKAYEGVYLGVMGPSYETPAEIKAFGKLGADIVGMSVVFEAIAAAQMGMNILGLAYVSNMAAGLCGKNLDHNEVLEAGKNVNANMTKIIKEVLEHIK